MDQEQFMFPSLYYTQIKKIGETGRRIAFMFFDSMLQLCASHIEDQPAEFVSYQAQECQDPKWAAWGRTQNKWVHETFDEWNQDGSIIYRVLVTHYPMWSLGSPMDHFAGLNSELLPLLLDNQFDLYLNAHDSVTSFADRKYKDPIERLEQPEFEQRMQNTEYWFKASS